MANRRRWLQYSLRGLLTLVTVFAIGLGWKVQRARKRGEAINTIQQLRATEFYDDGTDEAVLQFRIEAAPSDNRLWDGLKGTPVDIHLLTPLNPDIASQLSFIYHTDTIKVWTPTDADLLFLETSDARTIMLGD